MGLGKGGGSGSMWMLSLPASRPLTTMRKQPRDKSPRQQAPQVNRAMKKAFVIPQQSSPVFLSCYKPSWELWFRKHRTHSSQLVQWWGRIVGRWLPAVCKI